MSSTKETTSLCSLVGERLSQYIGHTKAATEAIRESPLAVVLVSFLPLFILAPLVRNSSVLFLQSTAVSMVAIILVWCATIYLWWSIIPRKWTVGSLLVTSFGDWGAGYIANLCGTDIIPTGAVLLLPFSPMSILNYGLAASCFVVSGFILTFYLLLLVSSFDKIPDQLDSSKEWYEKERTNGSSVKDFSEWVFNKYENNWRILVSFSAVLILTSGIDLVSLIVLFWTSLWVQVTYCDIIYSQNEINTPITPQVKQSS